MSVHHAHLLPRQVLGFDLPDPGPGGLTTEATRGIVAGLKKVSVPWTLVGPHLAFDANGYFRKRLYRDRDWEMLILCWLPGHTTVIHDHGGSWGGTLVLAGEIHEWTYRWRGDGKPLEARLNRNLAAPKVTVETLTTVHRVENRRKEPAVSLHIYSPPLRVLNSYEAATGKRHAVELEVSPSVAVGGTPQGKAKARPRR